MRPFGIEIEFVGISREQAAQAVNAAGLECYVKQLDKIEHQKHRLGESNEQPSAFWTVVPHSSVKPGGGEMVSPIVTDCTSVQPICKVLSAAGATVNDTTDLHVHYDGSDLDRWSFDRLCRMWYEWADAIEALVDPRVRGDYKWAHRLNAMQVGHAEHCLPPGMFGQGERAIYHAMIQHGLAVCWCPGYGTVEVRQHEGTIDPAVISDWVAFGGVLIELAKSDAVLAKQHKTPKTVLAELVNADFLDFSTGMDLLDRSV